MSGASIMEGLKTQLIKMEDRVGAFISYLGI